MDAAPREYTELPRDPELGVTIPFACGTDDGYGGSSPSPRTLDGRRVTQCALSRVCGVCGAGLGRPIAFLGSELEQGRNAFHFPPTHLECARALLAEYSVVDVPVLGQDEILDRWVLVTTAGFEFVRPSREDLDRRPTFQPNSVLEDVLVP
jgi:hypothetical protein